MAKKAQLVASFDFKEADHYWLRPAEQEEIIPRHVKGPVLFSVTPCLDEDGRYRGGSLVRCYEVTPTKPRSIPNGAA